MLKHLREGAAYIQKGLEARRQARWQEMATADQKNAVEYGPVLKQVEYELLSLFEKELKDIQTYEELNEWIRAHEEIFLKAGEQATHGEAPKKFLQDGWLYKVWSQLRHEVLERERHRNTERANIVREVAGVSRGELVQRQDERRLAAELGAYGSETEITVQEIGERLDYDYPALGQVFIYMANRDLASGLSFLAKAIKDSEHVRADIEQVNKNPLGTKVAKSAIEVAIEVPFERALRHAPYSVSRVEGELDRYRHELDELLEKRRIAMDNQVFFETSIHEALEESRYSMEVLAVLTTKISNERLTPLQAELKACIAALPSVDRERVLQAKTLNRLNQVREMLRARIAYFDGAELSEGRSPIALATIEEVNAMRGILRILDRACGEGVLKNLPWSGMNPALEEMRRSMLPKHMRSLESRLGSDTETQEFKEEKDYLDRCIRGREDTLVHIKNYQALVAMPEAELYQALRVVKYAFNLPFAWDEQLFAHLQKAKFLQKPNKTTLERLAGEFLEG